MYFSYATKYTGDGWMKLILLIVAPHPEDYVVPHTSSSSSIVAIDIDICSVIALGHGVNPLPNKPETGRKQFRCNPATTLYCNSNLASIT